MSNKKPVVAFLMNKGDYDSGKWESRKTIENDKKIETVYILVERYPDGSPYIIIKDPENLSNRKVLLSSCVDDVFVNCILKKIIQKRSSDCVGLQQYDPHSRSDNVAMHRRKKGFARSIEYISGDEDEDNKKIENENVEEICTSHHAVDMLSVPMKNTYFLEPHSNVVTEKSEPLNMMASFLYLAIDKLLIKSGKKSSDFGDEGKATFLVVYPDGGCFKKCEPVVEIVMKKLKIDRYSTVTVNKVRTGTNKDSKTRSTLAFPPELLLEIQQYEEAFILIPDDLMQSGGTLLDAGRLARDMILGGSGTKKPVVKIVLAPFHNLSIRNPVTKRFDSIDKLDALIKSGDIYAVYTTDSVVNRVCNLPEDTSIVVVPIVAASIIEIIEREKFYESA